MQDRRRFLETSAAVLAGAPLSIAIPSRPAPARGDDPLKVGLIGCGGRGTGAAAQALRTQGDVLLWAVGDVFAERAQKALRQLANPESGVAARLAVDEARVFVGFDACDGVLQSGVDVVILATPPHFRPAHFAKAVAAGKHVFLEKPVAVDGHGVRTVLAAGARARAQKLSVVCGLQRRYHDGYREAIRRVHDGAIGEIVAARCSWNMGYLWLNPRQPGWSDLEWQLRNWLYFTWLSGDQPVEQHVHNIDVVCWAKRAWPVRAVGVGGRQVRTGPEWGNVYDHHAVQFEFADGTPLFSMCRQIERCADDVSEHLIGTKGRCDLADGGSYAIDAGERWRFGGKQRNPYQTEHDVLFASIRAGSAHDDTELVANSTLTAIMGRMATYGGRVVTWDQALASERLGPERYEFGPLPVEPVAMPGRG
jgi:predicted dehydrogenase